MKRILAMLLAVATLLCCLNVSAVAEMENNYALTLKKLDLYMSNPKNSGLDINNIIEDFTMLGNKGYSAQLIMYSMAVQYIIEKDELTVAEMYVKALEEMPKFTNYLETDENGLTAYMKENCKIDDGKISIVPVSQIRAYIDGRKAEANEDVDLARSKYLQCSDFHDARERLISLLIEKPAVNNEDIFNNAVEAYGEGDYEKAAQLLSQIKDKYAPAKAMYDVVLNEFAESLITPTPEPTATPKPTVRYVPQVTATPTAKPVVTATPTAKPVVYSDWVETVPDGAKIVDKKTQYRNRNVKTEYRYRDFVVKTSAEIQTGDGWFQNVVYGDWSGYSETPVYASATLEVETSTQDVYKDVTVWNYSRWEYRHRDHPGMLWYSCIDVTTQTPSVVTEVIGWKYKSSTTRFTGSGTKGGCYWYKAPDGSSWYNENSSTKTETTQVTVYRSRTKTIQYVYQGWGSWSDWTSNWVGQSDTRQVETRTVNGDWSAWQDTPLEGNQVQTRVLYRYQVQ